jgi:hypothetical protein
MRTSSQFRQKLERHFGITFGAYRHDQSVSASGAGLCQYPLRISAERRIEQPLAGTQLVQQVCAHQRLSATSGAFVLA